MGLEQKDFSKHKTLVGYFNKNYVHTGIFSRELGHNIAQAQTIREDSDYDAKFISTPQKTINQIEIAKKVYNECKKYVEKRIKDLE